MEQKKITKSDLEKRMKSAVVLVPKDKETISVYFDDKGLRLTCTMDYAIVETNTHRHVFSMVTPQGISRPYIYVKRFIEASLSNDCVVKDFKGNPTHSYTKLMSVLNEKEDKTEYNICWFCDLWMFNIFAPLYSIDETEIGSFIVYEQYMHNIARNQILFQERKEDLTNTKFVNDILELERSFLEDINEHVILKAKTDEERVKEEIEAIQEQEQEQVLEEQIHDGGNA